MINAPGTGGIDATTGTALFAGGTPPFTIGTIGAGAADLGTDLSNDHPIGILYAGGVDGTGNPTGDLDFVVASSLPAQIKRALANDEQALSPYSLSAHINPYYLQADFDGDGRTDTAILVRETATGKKGILIVHGEIGRRVVIGAGHEFGNGGDDFSWMDAWYVHPRGAIGPGADGTDPPLLGADALVVSKTESASAIVYWNDSKYAWYQQGD